MGLSLVQSELVQHTHAQAEMNIFHIFQLLKDLQSLVYTLDIGFSSLNMAEMLLSNRKLL